MRRKGTEVIFGSEPAVSLEPAVRLHVAKESLGGCWCQRQPLCTVRLICWDVSVLTIWPQKPLGKRKEKKSLVVYLEFQNCFLVRYMQCRSALKNLLQRDLAVLIAFETCENPLVQSRLVDLRIRAAHNANLGSCRHRQRWEPGA
jgi:hypothetical protein